MNGDGGEIAAQVLRERLDYSIKQINDNTPDLGDPNAPLHTKLCGIHSSAIVVMLQCWKFSLEREVRVAKWGAIGGIIGGVVAGIGISVVNYLKS